MIGIPQLYRQHGSLVPVPDTRGDDEAPVVNPLLVLWIVGSALLPLAFTVGAVWLFAVPSSSVARYGIIARVLQRECQATPPRHGSV